LNQSGDTAEQIADADLGLFSNLQTVCYWCGAVRCGAESWHRLRLLQQHRLSWRRRRQ